MEKIEAHRPKRGKEAAQPSFGFPQNAAQPTPPVAPAAASAQRHPRPRPSMPLPKTITIHTGSDCEEPPRND